MNFLTLIALAVAVATTSAFDFRRTAGLPGVKIEGRITNGEDAAPGQFPYQVGLTCKTEKSTHFCGGSIISPKFILTAAHCTAGVSIIVAALGATKRTSPELNHIILKKDIHTHPKYNPTTVSNDIALLEMPFTKFTERIKAVKLPTRSTSYSSYTGDEAITSGWGRTSDKSGASEDLKYAEFDIISNLSCMKSFGPLITSSKMCTSTANGVSACQGDSGGPLVLTGSQVQVGIVSFGSSKGCEQGAPAAYTRVTSFLDWIDTIVKE